MYTLNWIKSCTECELDEVMLRSSHIIIHTPSQDIRVFMDGSLYLTKLQLVHAGNYTCHADRNKDVVQTHILTVHSK